VKTILIVDDSPSILMSMAFILASTAEYATVQARNGVEALALLRGAQKVDAMITDLNMPQMDGITLIRQARQLSSCRFIPFLVLTTESQPAIKAEAKAAGATGWLVKPVKAPDLLGVLRKMLA